VVQLRIHIVRAFAFIEKLRRGIPKYSVCKLLVDFVNKRCMEKSLKYRKISYSDVVEEKYFSVNC